MSDISGLSEDEGVGRRAWLGGAAIAGVGVVGGALAGAGTAAAQSSDGVARRKTMIVDVACDGRTFREQKFDPAPAEKDRRGSPFSVEGWIYPADTVSDKFIVTEELSIGRWFCAGFFIGHADREEPHINAQANFAFGVISPEALFPEDTLITYGLGGLAGEEKSHLAVLGGTGMHLGASGQAIRWNAGKNNTALFGGDTSSPNFRYEFDLLYPL
jgi:hypothetical protein